MHSFRFWLAAFLGLTLAVLAPTGSALADWYYTRITDTPTPSVSPRVTYDAFDRLHAFWEEAGEIRHVENDGTAWSLAEVVGLGHGMDFFTCLSCNEIYLVWIGPNDTPRFRSWESGFWSDESVVPTGGVGPVTAVATTKFPLGNVAWAEHDASTDESVIFFSEQLGTAWSAPVELGRTSTWISQGSQPIRLRTVDPDGRLIVSWVDQAGSPGPGLVTRTRSGASWAAEERLPLGIAGPYDVDSNPPGVEVYFAGNGEQPACPCNDVLYVHGEPGEWSESESIGTGHHPAEMEWPQEVSTHVRLFMDVPHVIWRHESYELLEMIDERLVLASNHGGIWSFDTEIAVGRNAHDPDLFTNSSNEMAVVWSEDTPGASDIFLATSQPVSDIPAPAPSTNRFDELSVFPNPTRGPVTMRWIAASTGPTTMRIYDPAGRQIARFGDLRGNGYVAQLAETSWDGRTAGGQTVPAGTYFIVVAMPDREVVEPLIVIR